MIHWIVQMSVGGRLGRLIFPLVLVTVLMFCGCSTMRGTVEKTSHYTFQYEPPNIDSKSRLAATLRVDRFTSAPSFESNRIAYQEESHQMDYYHYHKWWARPSDLVTSFLIRDLRQTNLFKAVLGSETRLGASHVMEGSVEEIVERDMKDGWYAVLAISVTLSAAEESDIIDRILFQRQYREIERCASRTPEALAKAVSKAMSRISHAVILDTYQKISSQ